MPLHITLTTHGDSYQSLLQSNVERLGEELSLEKNHGFQINLILDEICTNIFENNKEDAHLRIDITISWNKEKITVVIKDNGVPFDPTSIDEPDTSLPLSRREAGGLGLYFVKKYTDTFEYMQLEGRNKTTVTKIIDPPQTTSTSQSQ